MRKEEEERKRKEEEERKRLEEERVKKEAEEKDRQERFRRARQLSFERKTAKKKREEAEKKKKAAEAEAGAAAAEVAAAASAESSDKAAQEQVSEEYQKKLEAFQQDVAEGNVRDEDMMNVAVVSDIGWKNATGAEPAAEDVWAQVAPRPRPWHNAPLLRAPSPRVSPADPAPHLVRGCRAAVRLQVRGERRA